MKKQFLFLIFTMFCCCSVLCFEKESENKLADKYMYTYQDQEHTFKENAKQIGAIYAVSWIVYPAAQPGTFKNDGSWKKYSNNFGRVVFDSDEPVWNWLIHPATGSQLYLYYRANGYSQKQSLLMTTISSTLFEFTIEIYTEPASIHDLYQTPILGSIGGFVIENISLYLLNSEYSVGRFFGHLINPMTLFWFYEGKVKFIPQYDGKKSASLTMTAEF